jgi:hypothetical protein
MGIGSAECRLRVIRFSFEGLCPALLMSRERLIQPKDLLVLPRRTRLSYLSDPTHFIITLPSQLTTESARYI